MSKRAARSTTSGKPVGIFVLGMHRSGTSMLSRMLGLLGCTLPRDLLGANESNPTGHWESAKAIELNDALLSALGRRWDDVRELPADWLRSPVAEAAKPQIRALLEREFAASDLWLLKEPRLCRLAPLWMQVAADIGIEVRVILPVRHPAEVAYSLARRDGIDIGRGQLMWYQHLVEAERASRDHRRVLVHFHQYVADWRGQARIIADALGIDWPVASESVAGEIDAFINPGMRHADADDSDGVVARLKLPAPVADVYARLLRSAGGESWPVIAQSAEATTDIASLYAPAIDELASRASQLSFQLAETVNWPLTGHQLDELRRDSRTALNRIDQAGPLVVEVIRQLEAQRVALGVVAESTTSASHQRADEFSALLAKLHETDPLLLELVRQVEAQRQAIESGNSNPVLLEMLRQIETQRAELADQGHALRAELARQGENFRAELAGQVGQIERLADLAVAQENEISRLRSEATQLQSEATRLQSDAIQRHMETSQLQSEANHLQSEVNQLTSELAVARHEAATLADELARKRAHVDELLASSSWRMTAPLRSLSRLVTGKGGGHGNDPGGNLLRSVYRGVPMPWSWRLRIKSLVFRIFAPLLKNTDAYRRWQTARASYGYGLLPEVAAPPAQAAAAPRRDPVVDERQKYRPMSAEAVDTDALRAKAIAFYLPQFHPVPENDQWWGRGFTEWTNVSKARPQFLGHEQPKLPGELGFYDLRLPEVMRRQIELARHYGIHGFCFHYYWFDGRRILERPLDQFLADPSMDLPFCVCWANENWTRRWDGHDDDILLGQKHTPESDLRFIRDVAPILRDARCIRVGGRPLLIVYRPSLLPDCAATVARWRDWCRNEGIGEIFLAMVQFDVEDPRRFGFDAALEFPPHKLARDLPSINATLPGLNPSFRGYVIDYGTVVERSKNWPMPDFDLFRGVFPGWDNEARKPEQGYLFANASPEKYRDWLRSAVDYARQHPVAGESVVFVNAWNEWAEGAYLEPDSRYGYAYLEATREALVANTSTDRTHDANPAQARVIVVSHDAHPHGAQYLSLNLCRELRVRHGYEVDAVLLGEGVLTDEFAEIASVHFLPSQGGDDSGRALARRLAHDGARIAIANTTVSGRFVADLKAAGITVVSLVHELPGVIEGFGLQERAKAIATHADTVVFAADAVRRGFEQYAPLDPQRVLIRPQGTYKRNQYRDDAALASARASLRLRLGLPADARIVLSVGYADLRKGIDLFIEIGAKLVRRDPRAHLVWLGHFDMTLEPRIRAQVQATGLAGHFHFPGRDPDTDAYYAGSDVYALTSREDPYPTVIMEAFDACVPVVAFESVGGFEDLMARAGGRLVPAFDLDRFADECAGLLADEGNRKQVGRQGRDVVEAEFSFHDYVRDLLARLGRSPPKVSVIVPNFNYAHYLPERLRSIFGQTYPVHEVIVLDDASTDESLAVLQQFAATRPLRIIANAENSGSVSRQWQRGVAAASGDLVWIAEADDLADPAFLEKIVPSFQRADVVMAYCQSRQIDQAGALISPHYLDYVAEFGADRWRAAFVADLGDELRHGLAVKNTIPNVSGVVFRRAALAAVMDRHFEQIAAFRIAGDWVTYLRLLESGTIAYLPETLNSHRRHAGGVTIGADHRPHLEEVRRVHRWIAEDHRLGPELKQATEDYDLYLQRYFGLDAAAPAAR